MNGLLSLTSAQLRRAAEIKGKIEQLQAEWDALIGSDATVSSKRGPGRPKKEAALGAAELPKKKSRKMSAEGRARIAAAAKARWAKAKAAGKNSL